MKNSYLYDTQPAASAYKVPQNKMFSVLKSLYNDIVGGENEFVNNNKCWIYAFSYALIRRYIALYPKKNVKDIDKFFKNNEKFLEKVEEITHVLKN